MLKISLKLHKSIQLIKQITSKDCLFDCCGFIVVYFCELAETAMFVNI